MLIRRVAAIVLAVALTVPLVEAQEPSSAVAEVNGKTILAADVDAKLGISLSKLQDQIYALRQKQIETMIDQQLLEDEAARRKVTISSLVQSEITSRVTPVTDADAVAFYQENKAKLQGEPKALEEQIKKFLTSQRAQARHQEFVKSLRSSAQINVLLPAPAVLRSEIAIAGAPVRGAADAPVTIVEFSDFHCPYCRRVQPTLEQLRAKYGDRIKIVYRDLPLDNLHPQARAASEAALCANEQGKFWEFHDKVFASNPDGSPATLGRFAREIGLDPAAFEACRTSGKHKAAIQASAAEASRLGLTGTPSFFVNGRVLVGVQPLDGFSRVIDEELALAAKSGTR
jgi:protein-disulfide isomerase